MSDEPPVDKRRLRLLIVVAVLIGALIVLFAMERAAIVADPVPEPPAKSGSNTITPSGARVAPAPTSTAELKPAPGPTAVRAFATPPAAPPVAPADERSPVADGLNAADSNARVDLAIVANLFGYYLEQFREIPVGNNAEITAALAGDNTRGYAVLPARHPAINPAGELTDRWSTPYLFHQLAADLMEIRSAGPDRRRFTADDLVWPATETATLAETTL